jgi:hypothetical protein
MAEQSKLENVFSYSFPGNHLMQVSIVKQQVEQSYKKEHFCFITIAPGTQSPQGGRSFDFNNRITMKVEGHQVLALSHAVRAYVRGQEAMVGHFSIYVDSSKSQYSQGGGGGKSLGLQRTQNQKQNNAPMLTFFFKMGQNPALGLSVNPPTALAMADVFEFIGKKCLDLEFARSPAAIQSGAYENPNISAPPMATGVPQQETAPQFGDPNSVAGNFTNMFTDNPF